MIKPSFLFTDNAVLQRDKEIRVFGECDSITLTVEFADVSATARVEDGRFLAILPPMDGNICSDLVFRSESETVTLKNVVTGDVWLCSGQSNMEHPTFCTCYGEDTVAADDGIRLFTVPRRMYENAQEWGWHFYPTFSADTPWKLFEREAALRFSAIGVFFAKEIRKEINVPIGLISCDQGASNMEAWIDRDALLGNEITRYAVDVFDKRFKDIEI